MAQYRTINDLPPAASGYPHARRIALLRNDGATVYRLPDQSHVESRETWDEGTTGLTATPDPIPGDWTELT